MTITQNDQFVTIIAPTAAEAMQQFRAQGLDRDGYTIVHHIDRHAFHVADGGDVTDLFPGRQMFAATFRRPTALTL
ncbi:MAG TPA: hypothetical protein PK286_03290 [Devosia sp.]|nr:hypothetical protein [Devosia sp.]